MVSLVSVVGSLIVFLNKDGYKKAVFTIEKIQYSNDHESGLSWGFKGKLGDKSERLYAPTLADAKKLDYSGLLKKFPVNTRLDVWYNPDVTDTLFQKRGLRVIPYSDSLMAEEKTSIINWLKYSLLPLIIILVLGKKMESRREKVDSAVQRQ